MIERTVSQLISFTRDGEWGQGEPGPGFVPMQVIRGTDFERVRFGDLSTLPVRYIREDIAERKAIKAEDVLIETAGGTKDQPTGRTVHINERIIAKASLPLICASFARFLRPDTSAVDSQYLFWKLQAEYHSEALRPFHIQHTGVARFQYTQFATSHLFLFPDDLDEQRITAEVLTQLDRKIELNRRMNETLKGMAQAIFRDWFVDYGPVRRKAAGVTDPQAIMGGLITDPAQAATLATLFPAAFGADGLPLRWASVPFSSIVNIIGGGTPKTSIAEYWNGEIPWFSVADTPAGADSFVIETEKRITEKGLENSSARRIPAGTTIITARGTVGNLAIAGRDMTFNQSCYALRSSSGDFPYFIFLATSRVIEQLQSMAHGSVFSTITRQTFDGVSMAQADVALIEAFERLASPLFERIKAAVLEHKTLAATRDYLLPRLMSGAVRVVPQAEAA